jgi:hypothetical protein
MADGKLKLRYIDYICSCDQMRPVMDALEKQLDADGGIQIDLAEPPPDMSGPKPTDAAAVFSHQADLGRMCSPAYCLSKDLFLPLVAPVSISDPVPQDTSDRQALVPVYYSQFYVRKDSHYNAFEDLQGSVFAFTNVMSNVATANILLPSIACVGPTRGQHPLVMMMPVALSISLALLLPIGTPPNAIVLSNGNITLKQMATTGALCTIVFMVVNMCYCLFLVPLIFGEAHLKESILEACGIDSAE